MSADIDLKPSVLSFFSVLVLLLLRNLSAHMMAPSCFIPVGFERNFTVWSSLLHMVRTVWIDSVSWLAFALGLYEIDSLR